MKNKRLLVIAAAICLNAGATALAQESAPDAEPTTYSAIRDLDPPVTAGDITDRPYRVLGEVRAEVRKATIFSRSPSQRHVYRELWERAERLGADAVIHAGFGEARVTLMSWGSRRATGQAIKFLTDAEVAVQPPATEPAPETRNPQ